MYFHIVVVYGNFRILSRFLCWCDRLILQEEVLVLSSSKEHTILETLASEAFFGFFFRSFCVCDRKKKKVHERFHALRNFWLLEVLLTLLTGPDSSFG